MPATSRANTSRRRRGVVPVPLISIAVVCILAVGAGAWLLFAEDDSETQDEPAVTFDSALEAYEAGDYAGSEAVLERIVAEDGDDLEARKALADVYAAQGKNAEAIDQYAAVIEADDEDHASMYKMAMLERLMGDSLASIKHLEAAVDIERREEYLSELALTYVQVGSYAQAVTIWQEVLDASELDEAKQAGVYAAIATAYEGMRDYQGARAALEHALALMPNDSNLKARLDSLATP